MPCTSILPNPPPRCAGSMCAVVSSTASLATGAVAKPPAEGTSTGGAQIMCPTTCPSTTATRPHEPHSRSTIETQAAFSSASCPRAASRRTGSSSQNTHVEHCPSWSR